ncbi:MAG TPA: hypothetical protein VE422_23045 [Terriglobia bacterium]|nr:hypothetical protein [Terriglobia bacterium]
MFILNALLLLWLQVPAPAVIPMVIVGLGDGQQLVLNSANFKGFIDGRDRDAVLMYRQENFHGEMPLNAISRIEFGRYRKGRPFPMTVTLRNGQTLEVEAERSDFVMVKGKTDFGSVTIKHPDPISAPVKIRTSRPDRKNDLTIQYLEFPSS